MRYGQLRWVDAAALDKDRVVVVCPLGSLEQHGPHLAMLTDTCLVTGVAEGLEAKRPDRVLLTPTLWLGASDHHLDFPGTISVGNTVYTDMIRHMGRSFVRAGFRRILFLNGHGGNVVPGVSALNELANGDDASDDVFMALASYWTLAAPAMKAERHGMASGQLSHACEYETSLMLHLHRDWVVMSAAQATPPPIDSPFFHSERLGRIHLAGRSHRRTATGAMGMPEKATAEKGASLLAAIVDEVVAFVDDFASWKYAPVLKK